jgi:hypothetical protein
MGGGKKVSGRGNAYGFIRKVKRPHTGVIILLFIIWLPFGKNIHFAGSGNLASGDMVAVTLSVLPGEVSPGLSGDEGQIDAYLQANNRILAHTLIPADHSGSLYGVLSFPAGLPSGRSALQALSLSDGSTIVGSHEVYLGFPLLELLISTRAWWLGTMMLVTVLLVKRARYS